MAVAEYYGAVFVDGSSCYDRSHRSFDGLHMNAYGHQVVATRVFPVVEKLVSAKEETRKAQPEKPTQPVTSARSHPKRIERLVRTMAR